MAVLRLDIEYDGTDFCGWQIQRRERTVQGEISAALTTLLRRSVIPVGAGRTDSGVHAEGQVASLPLREPANVRRLLRGLNGLTGPDVVIRAVSIVDDRFHARRSARERRYRYFLLAEPSARYARTAWYPGRVDVGRMQAALPALLGEQDFTSFAASADGATSKVCRVRVITFEPWERGVVLSISADRFLHRMVRNLVGTLVQVGTGRRDPGDLPVILHARDRRAAGPTAPARGLVLTRVVYEDEEG